MSQFIFQNLSTGVKAREEILNGSKYLVAPLVMIVPGILNGSRGKGLYLEDQLKPTLHDWNGVPITLDHPLLNGNPVSARRPDILRNHWMGNVYNSNFDGKLRSEGWFHVNATKALSPKIHKALVEGTPFELSTGLNADTEPSNGQLWNGKEYDFKVVNIKPDHLAVLPDSVGACSLQDGCGVLVNEYSHSTLRNTLESLLVDLLLPGYPTGSGLSEMDHPYVTDVFDTYFVYRYGSDLYKMGYKADLQKEKVKLSEAKPVKVQRVTTYSPLNNKEPDMNPNVDFLIANCSCWGENDREFLNGLSPEKLKTLRASVEESQAINNQLKEAKVKIAELTPKKEPEPAPAPVVNKDAKPMTAEEWLNSAPSEISGAVRNALQFQAQERDKLLGKLIANKDDETKAKLLNVYKTMSISDLQILVENQAPIQNSGTPTNPEAPLSVLNRWAHRGGAEPTNHVQNKGPKTEFVTEHAMIFNEDDAA